MSGQVPHAAFCEEYDEDAHITLPETRQTANAAAKRSKAELKYALEPLVDGASDSGYSSRTAATVNSTQSGPSGRKSPPLKVDTAPKRTDLERVRSNRKDRAKDRTATGHPMRDDKMQVGAYPSSSHHPHRQRSPSRRRRDSAQMRHHPGSCWECEQGLYHPSTPVEPPPSMDYPYYGPQPGHVQDYRHPPPSPQTPRYPPSAMQDVHVSHSRPRARSSRSTSYHSSNRPVSFHESMSGMGGMMYNPSPMNPYDHGPSFSSSVYGNPPSYVSSHFPQHPSYFPVPDYIPPSDDLRDRPVTRSRDQSRRRSSLYGTPVGGYGPSMAYEGGESMERRSSREPRRVLPQNPYDRDEDFYRMPPPPMKPKPAPHIIQKRPDPPRKSATTTSVNPERRPSKTFDMSEMEAALPGYRYGQPSRETIIPERSRSSRDPRRNPVYYESSRRSRATDEGGRHRRNSVYNYPGGGLEEKQRQAEEYQAARSGKAAPMPLTAEALSKAKKAQRTGSESGSQESGSNSSRGSGGRTKAEDDKNITMTMNGVTMSFTQESVGGKQINVRTGDAGAVEFNIAGKRPNKYLTGGTRSDYTSSSGRRELEDSRRTRDDRRSDRASRRSSRSTYSSGRFLE